MMRNKLSTFHQSIVLASATSLLAFTNAHAELPNGLVTFINTQAGCANLGEQWGEMQAAHGRFILPVTIPKSAPNNKDSDTSCLNKGPISNCIGQGVGNAMSLNANGVYTPNSHSHGYTVSVNLGGKKSTVSVFGHNRHGLTSKGDHQASGTTKNTGSNDGTNAAVPFQQFPICEYKSTETEQDSIPRDTIAFFNRQTCPKSWQPYNQARGRFIMQYQSTQNLGRQSEVSWLVGNTINYSTLNDHNHDIHTTIDIQNIGLDSGGEHICTTNSGTTAVTGKTADFSTSEPVQPFVPLLICQKKSPFIASEGDAPIPPYMIGFSDQPNCPNNWRKVDAANRFFVGIPSNKGQLSGVGGGNPVEPPANNEITYPHTHFAEGDIGLGSCSHHIVGLSGNHFGEYKDYKKTRTYPYATATEKAVSPIWPFQQLSACEYTPPSSKTISSNETE